MKKILIIALVLLFQQSYAQNFEGTINWVMKLEMDGKEEELDQSLQSDEMDEAVRQMEKQMNDPEFKKQLDKNPEMKKMLEQQFQQMKQLQEMSKNGESFFPSGMTMKVKNGNSVITMNGGVGAWLGDILYIKEKDKSYSLQREKKIYKELPNTESSESKDFKITKTSETSTILNYKCTKYLVQTSNDVKPTEVWITTDIKGLDMKSLSRTGEGQDYFSKLEGFPLKVVSVEEKGTMIMEVVDIKRESLPESLFTIPADYKLEK